MGAYVNPQGMEKEDFLEQNGHQVSEAVIRAWDGWNDGEMLPVVWADNGRFTAAGIAYDAREREAFLMPDPRPKKYYLVPLEKLHEASSELQGYLDRSAKARASG